MNLDEWNEHPLVRLADQRSNGTLLGKFETLLELLGELETRFPGIPFQTILSMSDANMENRDTYERVLRDAGVSDRDIDIVLSKGGPQAGHVAPWDDERYELVNSSLTRQELLQLGYSIYTVEAVLRMRRPPSEEDYEIVAELNKGHSIGTVVERGGYKRYAVMDAAQRFNYRSWLETRPA
jgi:hypothetical protein